MKKIGLFILLLSSCGAFAQQSYYQPQIKKFGIEHYKKRIYQGCADLKDKQEPVLPRDIQKYAAETIRIVDENFSKAFKENPKIREAFEKDINAFKLDQSCQREANDCRARMLATAIYFYQQLRADIPGCQSYVKTNKEDKNFSLNCEVELRYRQNTLEGVQSSAYGTTAPQLYKKQLLMGKNHTTTELFHLIMQKDKNNLHICNSVQSGSVHQYALDIEEPGEYLVGIDPEYDPKANIPVECVEEKVELHTEFVQTSFEEDRATTGRDQVEPLKGKLEALLKDQEIIVTDVTVISSSSKAPFYTSIAGKKVLDPASNEVNLKLAKERASFAEKAFSELSPNYSSFKNVKVEFKSQLSGPDFEPSDLNERFVTKMTPGYLDRLEALHKKFKKEYEQTALILQGTDLLDSGKYVNLYQAKFKPFQGFKLTVKGYRKEKMKCLDIGGDDSRKSDKASKL